MTVVKLGVLLLVALLSGCGVLRSIETAGTEPSVKPDASRPASDAESLLQYFQHLKKLGGAELAREHDSTRQAFGRTRSEFNRVQLAMVLSMPNSAVSDESRALDLLDPVARNPRSALQGLAFLLYAYIQEHKRLDGNVQALQQKLEAIKSLERSLIEREQGTARKK